VAVRYPNPWGSETRRSIVTCSPLLKATGVCVERLHLGRGFSRQPGSPAGIWPTNSPERGLW
jgi:hypothetical protein